MKDFWLFFIEIWFFCSIFVRFWSSLKTWFFEIFDGKIGKMFECKICSKLTKFNSFLKILLWFLFFRGQILKKSYVFDKIVISLNTKFRVRVVKFVWRDQIVLSSFSRPKFRHTSWHGCHRKDHTLLISFRERIISKFVISITKTSKQNRDPKFPFSISWNFHGSPTSTCDGDRAPLRETSPFALFS